MRPAVDEAVKWLGGGIDVLLHVAGVMMGEYLDIAEFPEDVWDSVIDINLKGSFLMAKHITPYMERQASGVIVLTSSGAGVEYDDGHSETGQSEPGGFIYHGGHTVYRVVNNSDKLYKNVLIELKS